MYKLKELFSEKTLRKKKFWILLIALLVLGALWEGFKPFTFKSNPLLFISVIIIGFVLLVIFDKLVK